MKSPKPGPVRVPGSVLDFDPGSVRFPSIIFIYGAGFLTHN